jgi:phosphoenolpyruvate-protein kinase (PTS system EI component)
MDYQKRLEALGRAAAELDMAEGTIDAHGNILDDELLQEQFMAHIRCALACETNTTATLEATCEGLGRVANRHVTVRYSPVMGMLLRRRFHELAVLEPNEMERYPLQPAIEAYMARVFELSRAAENNPTRTDTEGRWVPTRPKSEN